MAYDDVSGVLFARVALRGGNLFLGSSLDAALKLLDQSEKGEILVEAGQAPH